MTTGFLWPSLVVAAYLIGAIPFGLLIARVLKGIDIRTVGSGNIGATNVARVLGFRYFWPVFLLDLAKGLLPTWGFPLLAERLTGRPALPELAVLVAMATILGHNFPVYLKFHGGKGVATSLGAFFALDPVAAVSAAVGFVVFLLVTRFVSMSSVGGGLMFFLAHFARVEKPWSRGERAMSVMTVALLVLLFVRHRKNFARIASGTEPRVNLRKKRDKRPGGRIAVSGLVALAVVSAVAIGALTFRNRSARREVLTVGRTTLTEVAREGTGYQRADRVAFADRGRRLVVTCPRYNRVVLYRVTLENQLERLDDISLDGKPVAVCPAADRLYILQRPSGDNRHVEPGWWDSYDFNGRKLGDRTTVGFYPDDMALSHDGRHAIVLTSGRGEGDSRKPAPALDVYQMGGTSPARSIACVRFDRPRDDPARLTLSAAGRSAVVTLLGTNEAAAVDLFEPATPRLIGRSPLALVDQPYVSHSQDDSIVMPVTSGRESVVLKIEGTGECVLSTLPQNSGLELLQSATRRSLGRLTLRSGAFGQATVRPTGLAFWQAQGLLAVANRSGGVHLVAVRPIAEGLAWETVRK